ncbi:Regulatory protein BlaR1 [Fervidicola ferrireducens]|uniref:Regulatory protein BlaR1 n=2 Tax=Fervidicola ferrireducens TaxID=520764 RepID=A0A140L0F5_9FIRM|nr:Regulatory protein BlaR1 [Fervidicola ferrireducens]
MNNIYNQLFIMSVVAGGIYLIFKILSVITLKYFSAAWHYYTGIAIYMFFLIPYHRWMSWLNLSSIHKLNPLIVFNLPSGGIPQQNGSTGFFVYFKAFPYILMTGTLIFIVVILIQYYNLKRRIFKVCFMTDDTRILEVLSKCKQQMGIRGQIPVYISPYITTPFLCGIVKPCIILPDIKLSADELQCIFLHELTHWKRRDVWLKLFMLFINAMHWFNPLAYAARLDIDQFCELSCDESVVKSINDRERRRYCELMLSVLWNVADKKTRLISAFGGMRKKLERRVGVILRGEVPMSKKWMRMVATAITLAIVLLGAILAGAVETSALEIKGSGKSDLLKPKEISNYQYQVNEYGETYGPAIYAEVLGEEPDLIAAEGIDGTLGYVRSSDLNSPEPRTPEEAVALNKLGAKLIPLYDKDGRTVIGQFKMETGGVIEYVTNEND